MKKKLEETISEMSAKDKKNIINKALYKFIADKNIKDKLSGENYLQYNDKMVEIILSDSLEPRAKEFVPDAPPGGVQVSYEYKRDLIRYLSRWGKFESTVPSVATYRIAAQYCYYKSRGEL